MIYQYSNPEKFETFEKPDFHLYSGNLVVWGAGRIGGVAEHCLRQRDVQICAFCDITEDKWGTEFCGHKVISPQQLKTEFPNAAVVISTVFHSSIVEELKQMGYEKVFDCSSLFMEIDFDGYDFWMLPDYAIRNVEQYLAAVYEQVLKQNTIDQIFLNITTACSLNCKDCSMFIPYVKNPCLYDAGEIMQDFNAVLDVLGQVRIVNFYGGEPLLHPQLADMIASLKDDKRIERISIITNATILPSVKLLEVLAAEKRIWLRISDYGELSDKLNELTKLLEQYEIKYEVANYTYWDSPSRIEKTEESVEALIQKFEQCTACNVLFLLNRKIYLCSTGSAVNNMGVFPPSESNCVDLKNYEGKEDLFRKDLIKYIERPKNRQFLDACRYCSGGHCVQFEDKHPVAVQTKEKLEFKRLY